MIQDVYTLPIDSNREREANEALAHAMQLRRLRDVIAKDVASEFARRDEEQQEQQQQKRSRLRAAAEAVGVCALGLGVMVVGVYMLWRAQ